MRGTPVGRTTKQMMRAASELAGSEQKKGTRPRHAIGHVTARQVAGAEAAMNAAAISVTDRTSAPENMTSRRCQIT